jgi:hypothetical protein
MQRKKVKMKCKKAKRIDDEQELMYEEYQLCSYDCLVREAVEEAIVCGDKIRQGHGENAGAIEIYNYHKNGVRWRGWAKK